MNRESHSREASREPRVNVSEPTSRGRTYGSIRGWDNSYSNVSGSQPPRNPTVGQFRTNDHRETQKLVEKVIPQIGIVGTTVELIPATRTVGKFQRLKQQR